MYRRIFLDTNPLIYLIEDTEPFAEKVDGFIFSAWLRDAEFYTSTVTDIEFLVMPYKCNDFETIDAYWEFLRQFDVLKSFITETIAVTAAKIRAKYTGIKTADSMQLAAAIESSCDVFLTNDKQLKQVEEVKVLLVEEL